MPRRFALLLSLFVMLGGSAFAQTYHGQRLVQANLIADTDAIVPGRPFTVGLLLKMAPGWHTYWQYPGDAGLATTIEWQLPAGFKTGPIQWPLPVKDEEEGGLETYVYQDEVLLMVQIEPPDTIATKQVLMSAKAQWLVCEKICIPGKADVALTLPVASTNQPAWPELFTKYSALLPRTDLPFKYNWSFQSGTAVLDVGGWDLLSPELKLDPAMTSLLTDYGKRMHDFFPLPAQGQVIDHPQIAEGEDNHFKITVPVTSGTSDQLGGVMVFSNDNARAGWVIPSVAAASAAAVFTPPPAAPPPSALSNLLRYLLFGFLGGIILNVMPCVLPVITLKIYGFVNQAGQSRKRIFQLGLAYCAGIFAWFLGLAALIVAFGLNWSFQFQNRWFVLGMMALCALFAFSLLGVFEVFIPSSLNTRLAKLGSKEGLGGAFVHGLFATLMGSACTAPLLGPAIGFALAQPPPLIFAFFGTIAAGMALPYFLLTANPGWMEYMPRPGMWMVRIKQFMGVLVLATAVWFGYVFYQQTAVKRDAFAPMLKAALKTGRPVFVDFTAAWCVNCKVNERTVLNSPPVRNAMKDNDVEFVTADWTNGDPDITQLLKQFGRAGVPAYVIYPAGSHDSPVVLPELLTRQMVINALNSAGKKPSNQ